MILDASGAFELLRQYRVAWLSGRFGAGKTMLATAMAEYLAHRYGYRIYANYPMLWSEYDTGIKSDRQGRLHAVIVLDEAGLETVAKLNTLAERMLAYLRKMDVIILLPSFIPPASKLRFLVFHPVLNLTPAGVPLAVYGWRVNLAGFRASGTFISLFPEDTYRAYDSFVPQDADITSQLYASLLKKVSEFAYGTNGATPNEGVPQEPVDIPKADSLLEVAEKLDELLSESVPYDAHRLRKRF